MFSPFAVLIPRINFDSVNAHVDITGLNRIVVGWLGHPIFKDKEKRELFVRRMPTFFEGHNRSILYKKNMRTIYHYHGVVAMLDHLLMHYKVHNIKRSKLWDGATFSESPVGLGIGQAGLQGPTA
ncbi:photosystem II CP47 chlorophyll apoprotein, putative [Medicago truncatula]|uniref:Photosystem II CP47 chlorophyll apoprotein, putative n=1 Tax=Medicago truncatula TaxID=3880 RepID=G7KGK9_MEDTR|nr:photosystem II CP47 chlorophyll apoprotein, putative [Medicago truncatula]